jgi:hypothetical protein
MLLNYAFFGAIASFAAFATRNFHDRLRLDLNRFAGLRIASQAGLAMSFYQAAEAGDHEYTVFLRLFNRRVCQVLQKSRGSLVVEPSFSARCRVS